MSVTTQAPCDDNPGELVELAPTTCYPASVLGKAHLILTAFNGDTSSLRLTELSRRSRVPKATVYRLATELVELGLLARTPDGYQLGWGVFELGQKVPGPENLKRLARPVLVDVQGATRAVIHLSVPQGDECVFLDRLASRREATVLTAVDRRVPSWHTASGRLFLAHSTAMDEQLAAVVHDKEAPADWRCLPDARAVRLRLDLIRERRWSDDREQCLRGYKTYAVPITAPGAARIVAAISATIPVDRRDDKQVIGILWSAAADISRSLQRQQGPIRDVEESWGGLGD